MKKIGALATAALLSQLALPAFAAETYAGLSIGSATASSSDLDDLEDMGLSVDDSDTALKLFIGSRLNENFAVEGFFAGLGEVAVSDGFDTLTQESSTLGISVVGIVPVNDQFELFGKIGFHAWDAEFNINGFDLGDDDGTDGMFGAGVVYKTEKFAIRGEFEQYALDEMDVRLITIGASMNF